MMHLIPALLSELLDTGLERQTMQSKYGQKLRNRCDKRETILNFLLEVCLTLLY